ncbi:MAG TPA: hypothetical protein VNZ55_04665 [Thermomicrobiales bacterium]|nr:hypothetical protein [Thermomicrobiales bacterium]
MLTYNPDIMHAAVDERQRAIRKGMRLAQAGITPSWPIRRLVGRLLIWSGEHVGGVERTPAPAVAPVIMLETQRCPVDLKRAA